MTKTPEIYMGEKTAWSINGLGEDWISTHRRVENSHCFCTTLKSKWIKNFSINPNILKRFKEEVRNTLPPVGQDKIW